MLRLGLVCDFAEEGWPSMDLVGDILFEQLQRRHSDTIKADLIRPAFRRRATALGILRSSHAGGNCDRLWNRMIEYPLWLRKLKRNYDLFHIVDHSYAHLALTLPKGRTVITCHDLDVFRCLTEPARDPRPIWYRAMVQRVLNGFRSARHVIFVSEAVRQEADRLGLISGTHSSVVHNGADYEAVADLDASRAADSLLSYRAGELLLLSVGSTVPRKRIDVLLRVFAGVISKAPGVRLIRVGGPLTGSQLDLARQLGVTRSITELPFVERSILSAVYRRSTLLLQPSEAEGFGLPVAEAMAHGCPVVASDLPALREIGGRAAIYCPVDDVSGWIQSVTHLLNQCRYEPALWSALRSRSIENARRFSWRENAGEVASVYREIFESEAADRDSSLPSNSNGSSALDVPDQLREKRTVALGHGQ
jgi:glycosyltransferase involved in cell wall biosynthesis